MAPSNMFSYLRPGHAKRNTSSLASPEPVASPVAHPLPSPSQPSQLSQTTEYFSSPRLADSASFTSNSPVSPFPPQLPPIPRVASKLNKPGATATATTTTTSSTSPLSPPHLPPPLAHDDSSLRTAAKSPTGLRSHGQNLAHVVDQPLHGELQHPPTHLAPAALSPNYSVISRSQTSLISGFSGLSEKLSSSSKPSLVPMAPPTQKSKSRLTLRNPMSLLMRRRSGQTLDPLSDESLVSHRSSSIPGLPDNYDPSIRGHIVHDFNAPRQNRNFSYNNAYRGTPHAPSASEPGRSSPPKLEKEHTPVFREHFDDDTSYEQSRAAIRAEQLANNAFLARNSYQSPPPVGPSSPPPPPLPKDSPPAPPSPPTIQSSGAGPSILSPVQEAPSPSDVTPEETPRKRKSTKTPPAARSRATSVTDPSFTPAGLPTHLTSRASRFSFQISGSDSAQEKILEDRHKQKAAEKASKEVRMSTNTMDDEYSEYGMDDFAMDDGYEEDIPMLGEEDDYEGLGNQTMSPGINAFDFSSLSLQPNNSLMSPTSMDDEILMSLDASGNPIGFAMSEDVLHRFQQPVSGRHLGSYGAPVLESRGSGLGDSFKGLVHPLNFTPAETPEDTGAAITTKSYADTEALDDDMYFDDGLIDDQGEVDDVEFDENVFDDPHGPLFERKTKASTAGDLPSTLALNSIDYSSSEIGYEADEDSVAKHLETSEPSLAHKTSVIQQRTLPNFNNIDAYHSALADAANRAEAEGRFIRKGSVDIRQSTSDFDDSSSPSNSRPSLIPDDGRFSQDTTGFPPDDDGFGTSSGFVDDYDYSDYDSALEDDPMIAAANAEALANDYEGFYGREFNFYASAQDDTQNTWGGFFGPSGLGRSISGRNAVHEPNLTPITERSEYSTRNSFISINHFRDGQQPIQSPGLAQLARMSPYGWREEEDMSLDSLMKLRKGAFGGSTASLPVSTSNSPRNSSPMGMQFVPRTASPAGNRMVEQTDSSAESEESMAVIDGFGVDEEDIEGLVDAVNAEPANFREGQHDSDKDDENDRPESPTLTASDYNSISSPDYAQHKPPPPLPSITPVQQDMRMQSPLAVPLPMSPAVQSLQSPSIIPLPTSPLAMPPSLPSPPAALTSPRSPHSRPPAPPSIDTNLSSPSATYTNSSAPRRQSLGFISPVSTTSPMTPGGSGWKSGHSRKGSAADSVTYVREHDDAGEGRWVLERRRTAESGELELVGRQIVEGGRI